MNEELIKVPVVELVYRNNTKPSKRYKITSVKDVQELLVPPFKDSIEHHISTRVILLNGKNQVLGISTINEGTLSYSITDIRYIVQLAALSNCKGLIVCINHPSSDIEPTPLDDETKDQVKIALSYIDVDLLDYILYDMETYYSYLAENRL